MPTKMARESSSVTASSLGSSTGNAEVKIVFNDQPRAARPKPPGKKSGYDGSPLFILLWLSVLVWGLLCLSWGLESKEHPKAKTLETDGKFRCLFINETTLAENNSTEVCDDAENKRPYCFAVFHQNMRTYNHKVTSAGCWSKDSDENDQCIKTAKGSDSESACIIQKISGGYQAIFCCCLRDMCSASFKNLPSIYIKQN